MSATSNSTSSVQRINRAYVDIQSSSTHILSSISRVSAISPHVASSSKVKENTPFQQPNMLMKQQASPSTSLKRKLSSAQFAEVVITSAPKKSKLSSKTNISGKETAIHSSAERDNATAEFPHGFVYCHQCNKKRDTLKTLHCSSVHVYQPPKSQKIKERSCNNKYCEPCLKNRYDDTPLKSKFSVDGKDFKCPKCRDICNCPRCRKSKGLDATGVLPKTMDTENSKADTNKGTKPSKLKTSSKVPPAKPTKPLPVLRWKRVPVQLSQEEADERIFIREFVMRFSPLFEPTIAKASVEELKHIAGKSNPSEEDVSPKDWVSEMCVRAIILGLLGMLAKTAGPETTKVIRLTIKELRAGGANLNKIWSALQSLRDSMKLPNVVEEKDPVIKLDFPDPLPTPVMLLSNGRNLRSVQNQPDNTTNIIHTTQLIPVVIYLMQASLETPLVREEIELGVKDAKDSVRDSKEAARLEQERWDVERKAMDKAEKSDKAQKDENRIKRQTHKDHITNLDNAVKILAPSYSPRFMPLGTDTDGRIYYALSSGLLEREAADEFLAAAMSNKRQTLKKKSGIPSEEERSELKDWSWFIAVWGKKAPAPRSSKVSPDSDDEAEDDDETADKWWAFWEPEEIRKVALWVSIKAGLDVDDVSTAAAGSASTAAVKVSDPTTDRYQSLVHALKDYATLLEWRIIDQKYRVLK
ncbi:hypothetical protein CVT24_004550 [Panaeolus cyanescens]|uniref:Zinc-finger domain-containing protein n=1 Tax=Panaeolus cyanescens TaxID=181874 RepID=A0A409VDA7_9AGAR|nr:hypothetical protein CVT24_004550 [Panaeolus cyanescens]